MFMSKEYKDKSVCVGCPYYKGTACIGIQQDRKTRRIWCKCEKGKA